LQRVPFDDIRDLRAEEEAYLTQYRWVEKGRVTRIPIALAMRLYVERAAQGKAAEPFTVAPMDAVPAGPGPVVPSPAGSHP
jgi:hypothetical protein